MCSGLLWRGERHDDFEASAVLYSVQADSDVDRAGLTEGDVVLSVNRHTVTSAADATHQLRRLERGQPAFLLVWREGNEILLQIRRQS